MPCRATSCSNIDQWILVRAEEVVSRCRIWYDDFEFHKVYRAVYDFATVDLSSIYFDVLKDRLYTSAPKSHARRSAQTALHRLALALVRLFAPILSFTMEEVWGHLNQTGSVHTAYFPESGRTDRRHRRRTTASASRTGTRLIAVRESVLKSLETARQEKFIGAPLEARVQLSADGDLYPLLSQYARELPGLFIVSQVELQNHAQEGVAGRRSNARAGPNASAAGNTPKTSAPRRSCRPSARPAPRRFGKFSRMTDGSPPRSSPFSSRSAYSRSIAGRNGWSKRDSARMTTKTVIPGFFNIVRSQNPGVAFGIFADNSARSRTPVLVGVVDRCRAPAGRNALADRSSGPPSAIGLALIFGGAMGNVFDRVRAGSVTDFLDFYAGTYHWYTFNVADASICTGAGLLILSMFLSQRKHETQPENASTELCFPI